MRACAVETGDFSHYPVHHAVVAAERQGESLAVTWSDSHVGDYLYLWLRDNCPCPTCVHEQTKERLFDLLDIPHDIAAESAIVDENGALTMTWAGGGHVSVFHPGWLRAHCYSDAARTTRRRRRTTWDASQGNALPDFSFADIMADEAVLLDWLRTLRDYGLTLIRQAPLSDDAVASLAERISFIRRTNFGVLWDVVAAAEPNSTAYTDLELPLHTDLPTRELQPGLQFLHCLVNDAAGGDSLLVDGFRLAEALAEEDPEAYRILTTEPLEFRFHDPAVDYRTWGPVIRLDHAGDLDEVRFNTFLRAPFDVAPGRMGDVYKAVRSYFAMTRDPRFVVRLRLRAGDLMAFENRRVLHARTAFDTRAGARRLRGCYVDRDEIMSRIRVLERTHGSPEAA